MTREEMLEEMDQRCWEHKLDEDSTDKEVEAEYEAMLDEYSDDSDMFPNGRDHDAEDEDGI